MKHLQEVLLNRSSTSNKKQQSRTTGINYGQKNRVSTGESVSAETERSLWKRIHRDKVQRKQGGFIKTVCVNCVNMIMFQIKAVNKIRSNTLRVKTPPERKKTTVSLVLILM